MFDFAWSELALIAVVAVVVIGPKDLPDAIRKVAKGVQKLRRMASEFQTHADELVREAKLEDVRDQIRDIRNFDLKSTIERNLDSDGEIRRTFNDNPLRDDWKPEGSASGSTSPQATSSETPSTETAAPSPPPVPAFVPPEMAADPDSPAPKPTIPAAPAHGADGVPADKPLTPNA